MAQFLPLGNSSEDCQVEGRCPKEAMCDIEAASEFGETRRKRWPSTRILLATVGGAMLCATAAVALTGPGQDTTAGAVPPPQARRLEAAPGDGAATRANATGLGGAVGVGDASTASEEDGLCSDAREGELCHRLVVWTLEDGLRLSPEKYASLSRNSTFQEVQAFVHKQSPEYCPKPCQRVVAAAAELQPELLLANAGRCDYGHSDPEPAHAGCFITRGGKMLAIKLTYDGHRYDIPGGTSDFREPARCTAFREAFEETGFRVAPRELLAVVRNNFHVYRCELLESEPKKRPDHEVAWMGWLSRQEILDKLGQHEWRFPEASRYADWLR